jgi:nickel-dependent lactate racemase
LILSIGQVVPHEVIGMANHSKNILIGTGGREGINRSHYLGAVYGMERIMGRAENPVRNVLNRASQEFLRHLPIVYVQTVVGRGKDGGLAVRGLYIGDDLECFLKASELSLKVNFEMLDKPIKKAVVLSRSQGVPLDVDWQQGGVPHAHGAGRWSGADCSGTGRA